MIVHVFNSCLVSGPETLVLPALPKLEDKVVVIFLSETRRPLDAEKPVAYAKSLGLETREVAVRARVDKRAVKALAELLQELQPSIAHAHDVKASVYLHAAARSIPQRSFKLVSTHHGVRARSGIRAGLYEEFYTRFVLPHYDRALVVCTSDRELLIKRGVPSEKIEVHINGIDRREIAPAERAQLCRELRGKWGLAAMNIPPDALILGFAARIASEKRLDRVLRVLKQLRGLAAGAGQNLFPEWHLLIFGIGPLERKLKALTHKLGLADQVHWMGYRHGLGDEMAGFDLLLSLSDAEGLPINLLEAGWSATPVFASAVDGNLDLFALPGLVTMVSLKESEKQMAEKLAVLVKDGEMRVQAGIMFQERVKSTFSGKRWLGQLKSIYAELAAGNSALKS